MSASARLRTGKKRRRALQALIAAPLLALGIAVGSGAAHASSLTFTLGEVQLGNDHCSVSGWFVFGLADTLESGLAVAFMIGLAAAIMAGLIGLRSTGPPPTCTRLQIHGRARFIAGRCVVGFVVGSVVGFPVGLAFPPPGAEPMDRFGFGLLFGLGFGLGGALAFGLAFGLEAPSDAADVVSANESLAQDRRNTIRKMLAVGTVVLTVILTLELTAVLTLGLKAAIDSGLTGILGIGLVAVVVIGFVSVRPTSAWIYWLVLVRIWLPLTGHVPWRIQEFLNDAYQWGVLRQTGAVYQFRHAQLQDHLTADAPAATPAADD